MKVWIVTEETGAWEPSPVLAIFSREEAALEAANQMYSRKENLDRCIPDRYEAKAVEVDEGIKFGMHDLPVQHN